MATRPPAQPPETGFSTEELERYYRKEPQATEKAILSFLRDSRNPQMIVFGARAVNAYLPDWLDKETKDWDILTAGRAKQLANKLESKLDERYGGDFFAVEPAVHPGTFRVRSRVTGSVVADISLKDRAVGFNRMQGVNYASLDWLEKEAEVRVTDPQSEFRRSKDRDTLQRIEVLKSLRGRKMTRKLAGRRADGRGAVRKEKYLDGSSVDTSMRGLS